MEAAVRSFSKNMAIKSIIELLNSIFQKWGKLYCVKGRKEGPYGEEEIEDSGKEGNIIQRKFL